MTIDTDTEAWKGYVALLDILGFRAIVSSGDFQKKAQTYSRILDQSVNKPFETRLRHVTFSDSIVVSTGGSGVEDLEHLLWAVGELCYRCLVELNWPIRGAVSFGQIIHHTDELRNTIVAGVPIIDAYYYEKRQKWIGVLLAPRALENVDETRLHDGLYAVRYDRIPFGDGDKPTLYSGCALIPRPWTNSTPSDGGKFAQEILEKLQTEYTPALDRLRTLAPEPTSQSKIIETQKWVTGLLTHFLVRKTKRV